MKERFLVTVKTYPVISATHNEVVCTAGLREDGTWVRLYPVPFRDLEGKYQYRKYNWIEAEVERSSKDARPESRKLLSCDSIKVGSFIDIPDGWRERKAYVLEKGRVFDDLDELIRRNKNKELSLATFKPTKIVNMKIENDSREWSKKELDIMERWEKQIGLFPDDARKHRSSLEKLPYKFSYELTDAKGKTSKMMITDWEIGMLYRRCLERHDGNKVKATEDVRKKYIDDFAKTKDLHLFLGTTAQFDARANNPFIIVGTFTPPIQYQRELL